MNVEKIAQPYEQTEEKVDDVSTLSAEEWNSISEGVETAHVKINEIIDSTDTGISKSVAQINQIKITPNPATVYTSSSTNVKLTATSEANADRITITGGGINSDNSVQNTNKYEKTISFNVANNGQTVYTATVELNGVSKSATCNVQAVHKIYYGAGPDNISDYSTYISGWNFPTNPSTSPAGNYQITTTNTNNKIYILIPAGVDPINLDKVFMGALGFNLTKLSSKTTYNNIEYTVYKSSGTYNNQTINITIQK